MGVTGISDQEQISGEIASIQAEYEVGLANGAAVNNRTVLDYPPYRSSVLRHPTKDLHHTDPETIELVSPAFGQRDVDGVESDLTIQHSGEPLGERIVVTGRVLDGDD